MDPNTTLRIIEEEVSTRSNRALENADLATMDLQGWIEKGGVEPDWNSYPKGTAYFWLRFYANLLHIRLDGFYPSE